MSKKDKLKTSWRTKLKTFIHPPFQPSPAPRPCSWSCHPTRSTTVMEALELPMKLHIDGVQWHVTCHGISSATGSKELGTISSLHIIAKLNKPVIGGFFSTWSNEVLSIICTILGISKHPCYPQDLALSVLTWNSTGQSISPFSMQYYF